MILVYRIYNITTFFLKTRRVHSNFCPAGLGRSRKAELFVSCCVQHHWGRCARGRGRCSKKYGAMGHLNRYQQLPWPYIAIKPTLSHCDSGFKSLSDKHQAFHNWLDQYLEKMYKRKCEDSDAVAVRTVSG